MANLYVYADFGEDRKVFYVADRETGKFVELEQRDFEEQYECYQMDLDRSGGIRPWESVEKTVEIKNLTQSSGKVVACEGEERQKCRKDVILIRKTGLKYLDKGEE